MLMIPCPHCGPRNASDLHHVGEAKPRPDVNHVTPAEWRAYLYLQANPAGWITEVWYCRSGCRQYFELERNTATNEFRDPPLPGNKIGSRR